MKRIFLVLSIIFTFLLFTDVSYSLDSSSKSQQTEEYQKKEMKKYPTAGSKAKKENPAASTRLLH